MTFKVINGSVFRPNEPLWEVIHIYKRKTWNMQSFCFEWCVQLCKQISSSLWNAESSQLFFWAIMWLQKFYIWPASPSLQYQFISLPMLVKGSLFSFYDQVFVYLPLSLCATVPLSSFCSTSQLCSPFRRWLNSYWIHTTEPHVLFFSWMDIFTTYTLLPPTFKENSGIQVSHLDIQVLIPLTGTGRRETGQ